MKQGQAKQQVPIYLVAAKHVYTLVAEPEQTRGSVGWNDAIATVSC